MQKSIGPLHKENSTQDKENYRPVSILPILSKLYERAINAQLMDFFESKFYTYLSAFRPGYGCQSTLLRMIENWKQALGDNKYVAAILMDLLKAFNCLPHDLLLLKLKYYGLSENALKLMKSYLTNRKQCVKLGSIKSDFQAILKGVPHRSILGPVLFNYLINDILLSLVVCIIMPMTIQYYVQTIVHKLSEDSVLLIRWFQNNKIKANSEKIQAIAVGEKTKLNLTFNLDNNVIKCEENIKLLGVTIDFQLIINDHVSNICKWASKQLNVLKRIGKHLCRLGRLNMRYSFILSNFNYCPLTWHFCGEVNTKEIEKIQEWAFDEDEGENSEIKYK